jgi:hypothetical protein
MNKIISGRYRLFSRRFLLAVLIFISANKLYAEDEIVPFNENFALNLYGNFNLVEFNRRTDGKYEARSPWSIGLGFRYKNISARVFIPLFYDNNPFDAQANFYFDNVYYETFLKRYANFRRVDEDGGASALNIVSGGVLAGWVQNNKRHSLGAIYNLDKKQTVSGGSFLYGFGVFYTSIQTDDESAQAEKRRLVYFGPTAGYSYTLLPGQMFLNLNFAVGLNAGIDTETGIALFVPQIMPKLTAGRHNKLWSVNFIGGCAFTSFFQDGCAFDNLLTATITLALSRRF